MEPASGNSGFFQRQPILKNQFHDDVSFQRVLKLFVPSEIQKVVEPEIARLGEEVLSDQIFSWVTDAEKNLPYIRGSGRDAFGRPTSSTLIVTEGWRRLQDFGIEKGMVAFNYEKDYAQYNRVLQFLRVHLWESSSANTPCPGAMTDGAARLLQVHLAKHGLDPTLRTILQNAFEHIISRDPDRAWTSGQWMTERPGGSDVSQTESVATYAPLSEKDGGVSLADYDEGVPLGPWSISGFKFFSSATDSSMTILLAKTKPGLGVSAFFAPMRRYNPALISATGKKGGTELNGVNIQRLKDKFGTKSLPTAELELVGMRGWLLGEEGKGINEISTILNITRVHSSIAAMGYLGRALGVARAYALVREIGAGKGKRIPLCQSPLHMRTLAGITGDYHALMLLTFFTAYIMGLDETASKGRGRRAGTSSLETITPPPQHVAPLMRVLSSLHKAYCCKQSVPLIFACMESLGGVGYLVNSESEHINLSRIFRDACVLPIWEGTTDVLSTDTLRALKHPRSGKQCVEALDWLIGSFGSSSQGGGVAVVEAWESLKGRILNEPQESLLPEARDITFRIAEILAAVLLTVDAKADDSLELSVIRRRFFRRAGLAGSETTVASSDTLATDASIVYGSAGVQRLSSHL